MPALQAMHGKQIRTQRFIARTASSLCNTASMRAPQRQGVVCSASTSTRRCKDLTLKNVIAIGLLNSASLQKRHCKNVNDANVNRQAVPDSCFGVANESCTCICLLYCDRGRHRARTSPRTRNIEASSVAGHHASATAATTSSTWSPGPRQLHRPELHAIRRPFLVDQPSNWLADVPAARIRVRLCVG